MGRPTAIGTRSAPEVIERLRRENQNMTPQRLVRTTCGSLMGERRASNLREPFQLLLASCSFLFFLFEEHRKFPENQTIMIKSISKVYFAPQARKKLFTPPNHWIFRIKISQKIFSTSQNDPDLISDAGCPGQFTNMESLRPYTVKH